MDELIVPANALRAASLFVKTAKSNTDTLRFVSVYVSPRSFEVVATDSFRLFCHTSPDFDRDECIQILVPDTFVKSIKSSDRYVIFEPEGRAFDDEGHFQAEGTTTKLIVVDKNGHKAIWPIYHEYTFNYPNYWRLYEGAEIKSSFEGVLNADFLQQVCKVANIYKGKDAEVEIGQLGNSSGALFVTLPTIEDNVSMIVMPVRR